VALGAVPAGSAPAALALEPLGRFLFALDSATQELGLYDLDAQSGSPAHRTGWLTRGRPVHVTFGVGEHALASPSFELLAAARGSSELFAHPVDGADGSLGQGVSIPTGNGPASLSVDPRQRFAFTGNVLDDTISRYRIDAASGALTELQPPLQVTGKPICVACDASGRFLYVATREVADPTDGFLSTFAIDPASGALSLLGSVATGFEPNWLGTDPTGQFVYVANTGDGSQGSATIAVFRLGAATGLPTGPALQQPAPGVWSLGFHPSGRYLYAALRAANSAVPFAINPSDGSLSPAGSGVQLGTEPVAVAVRPDGKWAYVAYNNNGGAGSIGLYAIDPDSGVLIPPASPFLDGVAPADLVIDGSGRFLYSANSGTDTCSAFAIEPSDGFLQPLTPAPTGLVPSALALLQRWQ
jgi:6-phosphogluconolactonase (cycloisomerase 2 family)